jgi:hypothetical protein
MLVGNPLFARIVSVTRIVTVVPLFWMTRVARVPSAIATATAAAITGIISVIIIVVIAGAGSIIVVVVIAVVVMPVMVPIVVVVAGVRPRVGIPVTRPGGAIPVRVVTPTALGLEDYIPLGQLVVFEVEIDPALVGPDAIAFRFVDWECEGHQVDRDIDRQ